MVFEVWDAGGGWGVEFWVRFCYFVKMSYNTWSEVLINEGKGLCQVEISHLSGIKLFKYLKSISVLESDLDYATR